MTSNLSLQVASSTRPIRFPSEPMDLRRFAVATRIWNRFRDTPLFNSPGVVTGLRFAAAVAAIPPSGSSKHLLAIVTKVQKDRNRGPSPQMPTSARGLVKQVVPASGLKDKLYVINLALRLTGSIRALYMSSLRRFQIVDSIHIYQGAAACLSALCDVLSLSVGFGWIFLSDRIIILSFPVLYDVLSEASLVLAYFAALFLAVGVGCLSNAFGLRLLKETRWLMHTIILKMIDEAEDFLLLKDLFVQEQVLEDPAGSCERS